MIKNISALLCFVLIVACEQNDAALVLATPASPFDQDIANDLTALFASESDIQVELTDEAMSEESAMEALLSGAADIALISNSMPYREGVATIMPLYPTVLHVGYTGDRETTDVADLLQGTRIYAGPEGSASREMFQRTVNRPGTREVEYRFVEEPGLDDLPDVFVVFVPISPDVLQGRMRDVPQYKLVSMGPPDSVGTGSRVDALVLLNPYLRPFVIPVGTYGDSTPEPVLTLAVDKMLLARGDLDKSIVYDLINELVRLRPALAANLPGLFHDLSGDFDASRSTFVLHTGAQAYLQRSAPTSYERYSGIAEVVVTLIVALASATFAGVRIFRMRRKNRIDTFYSEAIRLRSSVSTESSEADRHAAIEKIRDLQNTAFELLVDEKLAANESFRIFITLSNDVIDELSQKS